MHKRWIVLLSMVGLALSTTLVNAQVLKGSKPSQDASAAHAKGAANERRSGAGQQAPRQQKQVTSKAGKQNAKRNSQVK